MLKSLASLTACLLVMASPALAATPDSPSQIVGRLYAPYLANPHAEPSDTASAMDLIRPFASKSFGAAIDKDQACMAREQGICNLDWDVIINGQDWDISQFAIKGDGETVETYSNGNDIPIRFRFVKEDGIWKIDDVEDSYPNDNGVGSDGKIYHMMSIKAVLNR